MKKQLPATASAVVDASDPLSLSRDCMLVVTFSESRSPSFASALALAQQADRYGVQSVGGATLHAAGFLQSRESAMRARALTEHLKNHQGVQCFAGGKGMQSVGDAANLLSCYLTSTGCKDFRAHCHKIVDNRIYGDSTQEQGISIELDLPGFRTSAKEFAFPCARLLALNPTPLHARHPANAEDQIQAAAINAGTDWCPNFDASAFMPIED